MNSQFPSSSKSEWEQQAQRIVAQETVLSDKEIQNLPGWLRDMNWPGADLICQYLGSQAALCLEPVRAILTGDDDIWKANVLNNLVASWEDDQQRLLVPELLILARQPDPEEVHLAALEVCVTSRLFAKETLLEIIAANQQVDAEHECDYQRLLGMLNAER